MITLIGKGFTGATTAASGLQQYTPTPGFQHDAPVTVISDTQLTMTIPADAGTTSQPFVGNSVAAGWAPSLFTLILTTPPKAPTGLTAAAGNASVSLAWTGSVGANTYNVKRGTVTSALTTVGSSTTAAFTDSTVVNGTTYFYAVSAVGTVGESANSAQVSATPFVPAAGSATITVGTSTHKISPFIYGVNFARTIFSPTPVGITIDRLGGNRLTAYNWTTNASNAGDDFQFENDGFFSETAPAGATTDFIAADQAAGMASIISVPMQGLVAGDEAGPVSTTAPPDLTRFKSLIAAKGAPFSLTPSLTGSVFNDEFIWAVSQKFPGLPNVFVSLDNEPDIWGTTHSELGAEPTPAAFIANTIATATAIKNVAPSVKIFGPVNWGFTGLYYWQGAVTGVTNTGFNWFVDLYAQALAKASATYGKPLVDVYDFHWYSAVTDPSGNAITGLNGATLTDAQVQAIVQSPRSLWDTTFVENSWITADTGIGALAMLPRLQAKLAAANPGMQLAITEYNNGGAGHIAGTIAQADNLGVFGAQNLFAANLWPLAPSPFIVAGFRAFRNFDGAGSNFGDTSVAAASSAIANVSAYVSTDSTKPGRVVMVLINRSAAVQNTTVSGQAISGTAHLYRMSGTNTTPQAAGTQAASGSSISFTLSAYSVTTVDIL